MATNSSTFVLIFQFLLLFEILGATKCNQLQVSRNFQVTVRGDCIGAPDRARGEICRQLSSWSRMAAAIRPPPLPSGPTGTRPRAPTVSDCMTWHCVCKRAGGITDPTKRYCLLKGTWFELAKTQRKEYRTMSDEERRRFHAALNRLKTSGHLDTMINQHANINEAPGAHGGPAFLPWHREFLKRLEIALRLVDWSVSLPYWDSTLDEPLANPSDSIIWSEDFMGETDTAGDVVTGPFNFWKPTDGLSAIQRDVGRIGSAFTEISLSKVFARDTFHRLAADQCPVYKDWDSLEVAHGLVHLWVGGHMFNQLTSPNDPVFFLHHGFVDLIWERWRQQRQNRWQRENDYTAHPCRHWHAGNTSMQPFGPERNNKDGLSNAYTDHLYTYDSRPTCGRRKPNCGSGYLICDVQKEKCVARVKASGNCSGFDNQPEICALGHCINGQCRHTSTTSTTIAPPNVDCYNMHPCCSFWARDDQCRKNAEYMLENCNASCGACQTRSNIVEVCGDVHPECQQFAIDGKCWTNRTWMAENCHKSCNWCKITKLDLCRRY